MPCQVIDFPNKPANPVHLAEMREVQGMHARAKILPPEMAGMEYAESRLKDAVSVYCAAVGYERAAHFLVLLAEQAALAHVS